MKKYGKIIKIAFAFLLQLFLFASCGNLTDSSSAAFTSESSSKTGTTVILNGTLSAQGAFPQAVIDSLESSEETESRAAIPAVPESAYYYLLATPDSGDTVSGDSKSGTFTVTEGTFALPLASGKTWNVEIGIKNSSDTVILSDSYSVTLTDDDPVILHTFVLQASSGGTGSVSLSMNVCNTVTKVTSSCADSGWTNNVTTSQTYITGSAIPSGTYEVTLNFYSSSDILLYSTVQNISVLSGMETDYWKDSASSSASLISNGKLELTQALITSFARSTFYIGNTSVGTASSSGNGSPYAPFESLNQAVSAIAVTGSSSNDYRIFVNGTLTGINEISSSVNGKAQSITVSGLTGNSTDILNGNSEGTVLTVSTTVPVTIRKLKITGGFSEDENGGGLNIAAGADVTLGEGSLITGNSARYGAGIYNSGNLTLTNGVSVLSNTASGDGGGIYNKETLTLSGGTISANEVTGASSAGGGVYNTKTFTMTGGTIGGSTASNANKASGSAALGGGVGNYGSSAIFTMQGGLISHNEAEKGGGVYGESSAVITIEDGTISENSAAKAGGGIYVSSLGNTDKIEIKGGTISSNSAGEGGAGIMAVSSNLKISGGTIQKNSAGAYAGGGICFNGASNTLTISGGTIGGTSASEANTAGEGAGIYLTQGTLNITGGTISYNTATTAGGAIYVGSSGNPVISMTGGTISYNSCTATTASIGCGGGGIYANKACTLTGGTISSNTTANSMGGAIYAAVSPSVGSSVSIPTGGSAGNNDIYLATSISVNITSEISSSSKILLTPNDYTVGRTVLSDNTSSNYTKFTLSNTSYEINSEGKIYYPIKNEDSLKTAINAGITDITLSANFTITTGFSGTSSNHIKINGNSQYRLTMTATSDITFEYVDFSYGKTTSNSAGGMLNLTGNSSNTLTVKNCTFTACSTPNRNNESNHGGSLCAKNFKTVTISDTTFYANSGDGTTKGSYSSTADAAESGGFVYIDSGCTTVTFTNCRFTGGYSSHGGAMSTHSGTVTIDSCTFTKNYANWNGGAIDYSSGTSMTIKNSTFNGNSCEQPSNGANLYISSGNSATITGCTGFSDGTYSGEKGL